MASPPLTAVRSMELATGQGYQASRYREDMATPRRLGIALIALMLGIGGMSATPAPGAPGARAAPPELVKELRPVIEHARQRFEARDATGVLAHASEQYRRGGRATASPRRPSPPAVRLHPPPGGAAALPRRP